MNFGTFITLQDCWEAWSGGTVFYQFIAVWYRTGLQKINSCEFHEPSSLVLLAQLEMGLTLWLTVQAGIDKGEDSSNKVNNSYKRREWKFSSIWKDVTQNGNISQNFAPLKNLV